MNSLRLFFNEINKVYDCNLTKIRVGNKHDGGYITLKEICEKTKKVYSFGIGDDIGFEMDFVKRFSNSIIQCFDPTIDSLPVYPHNMFTEKLSLNKENPKCLKNIDRDSLLKMDIEWNEWDMVGLSEMFYLKNIIRFDQIIIELHLLHVKPENGMSLYFNRLYTEFGNNINEWLFEKYYRVIKTLNNIFYIFHIHPNNSLPKVSIGEYTFPPLIEVSFVRKDLVSIVYDTHTNFPVKGLDFPNKIDRPDIFDFYPLGGKIDE